MAGGAPSCGPARRSRFVHRVRDAAAAGCGRGDPPRRTEEATVPGRRQRPSPGARHPRRRIGNRGGRQGGARGRRLTRRSAWSAARRPGRGVGTASSAGTSAGRGQAGAPPHGGRARGSAPPTSAPLSPPPPSRPFPSAGPPRPSPPRVPAPRPARRPGEVDSGVGGVRGRVLGARSAPQSGFAGRPPRGRARESGVTGGRRLGWRRTAIFGVVPVVLRSISSRPFIRSLGETFMIHGERERESGG